MNFNFNLTYAGVPFLVDKGKAFRYRSPEVEEVTQDGHNLAEKQQPEPDLLDEINRLIRFNLIQDQGYPGLYSDRNVSNLARKWPVLDWPNLDIEVGDWFYPWGATRWSVFRGLATSAMVQQMLAITNGANPAQFVMQAAPVMPKNTTGDSTLYTLESNLYMLPPRPLAEHGGGFQGLFLITLVDERFFWQGINTTFRINQNTTWTSLFNQLISVLNINITLPSFPANYTIPEADSQLWANEESAAVLLDAVCYNLGLTLVRDLNGTYEVLLSDQSRTRVYQNRNLLGQTIRLAGGDIFSSGEGTLTGDLIAARNSILPSQVTVNFPKYIVGNDPVPHFVNPRYGVQRPSSWYEDSYGDTFTINVPILSGNVTAALISGTVLTGAVSGQIASGLVGVSGYFSTVRTNAKALYSGEAFAGSGQAPLNLVGLTFLAMQICNDAITARIDAALDEVYPGTFNWTPDGIHDIIWNYTAKRRKASTRILRSQWDRGVSERQNATPVPSGSYQQTNIPGGTGGPSVAQTWRDSTSGPPITSGFYFTTLQLPLAITDTNLTLVSQSCLPTQNRWYAQIDNEILQLEGTSGGVGVTIVQRGLNGTLPVAHLAGATLILLNPSTTYGVNLITFEKNQYIYPSDWRSGGIQGIDIVPQCQTVQALTSVGVPSNGLLYYSGQVNLLDPTNSGIYQQQEFVWFVPRVSGTVNSGEYLNGVFAGYSQAISGAVAPIYLVDLTAPAAASTIAFVATVSGANKNISLQGGGTISAYPAETYLLTSGVWTSGTACWYVGPNIEAPPLFLPIMSTKVGTDLSGTTVYARDDLETVAQITDTTTQTVQLIGGGSISAYPASSKLLISGVLTSIVSGWIYSLGGVSQSQGFTGTIGG